MKSIGLPVFVFIGTAAFLGYFSIKQNDTLSKASSSAKQNASKLSSNTKKLSDLRTRIAEGQQALAANSEFITEWESMYKRNVTGLESRIQDGATLHEVVSPMARADNPVPFAEYDGVKIDCRHVIITADGTLTGLARFLGEIERSVPLGIVQSVSIKYAERQPKMDVDFTVLARNFEAMPVLPEGAVQNATAPATGTLARRPDTRKFNTPVFSDNLMARTGNRQTQTAQANPTEITNLVKNLNITGVVWNSDSQKRLVMANGFVLRPNEAIPSKMVTGDTRVVLTEIGTRFVRFRIEKEVLNPVTGKMEKDVSVREVDYSISSYVNPEG